VPCLAEIWRGKKAGGRPDFRPGGFPRLVFCLSNGISPCNQRRWHGTLDTDNRRGGISAEPSFGSAEASEKRHGNDRRDLRALWLRCSVRLPVSVAAGLGRGL